MRPRPTSSASRAAAADGNRRMTPEAATVPKDNLRLMRRAALVIPAWNEAR